MEETTLHKFKYALQRHLDEALVHELANMPELELQMYASVIADQIVIAVRGFMLGDELERVSASWPANWWEAVKSRFLPEWAKKRWPIRYERIMLEAKALYPKMKLPDKGPVLRFDIHDG